MDARAGRLYLALVLAAIALVFAIAASSAAGATRFERIDGDDPPQTPAELDQVGILQVGRAGRERARDQPGDLGERGLLRTPLAGSSPPRPTAGRCGRWSGARTCSRTIGRRPREGGQADDAGALRLLPRLPHEPEHHHHYKPIPDPTSLLLASGACGSRSRTCDGRRAGGESCGGKVVLGGHSLGGSITTAYATWDFNGEPGAEGLSGLVYIDGGSGPDPVTPEEASESLAELEAGSPWLVFGGIAAPFAGLFNVVGSTAAHVDPDALDAFRERPLRPTLEAARAGDQPGPSTATRWTRQLAAGLRRRAAHLGHLAASGDPRGWDPAERSPRSSATRHVLRHRGPGPRRHRLVSPAAG